MCPGCNPETSTTPVNRTDMVGVESQRVGRPSQATNGVNGHTNGANGRANGQTTRPNQRVNPYAPQASDFLNNVANFKIIESTLRGQLTFSSAYM